ncbi:MAG: extracellular solute-binding protein [Lachnospiraceae bacterium]|nr:extracellular solute-binding protein [Lachnospiraceae bacterium]
MKKLGCILLSMMLLMLPACGNKDSHDGDDGKLGSINYMTEFIAEINMRVVEKFSLRDDRLILLGINFDSSMERTVKAVSFDLDGKILEETVINPPDRSNWWPSTAYIDEEGFFWFLCLEMSRVDDGLEYKGTYIDKYDQGGNYLKSLSLSKPQSALTDKANIKDFIVGDDGYFYVCANDYAAVFDGEGNVIFEPGNLSSIVKLPDGRIIAKKNSSVDGHAFFAEIDVMDRSLGEEIRLEAVDAITVFYSGGNEEHELLESTAAKLYGLDLEAKNRTELVSRINQGIIETNDGIHEHIIISGEHIFMLESQKSGTGTEDKVILVKLTKTDLPLNGDKKIITLASINADEILKQTIVEFNRKNPGYLIQIKTYQKAGQSINEALTDFNLDLISDNVPDIIVLRNNMPLESYASKGLFADLYEYMDEDPDIKRSDYLPNILRMLESDGKLNSVAASFSINTVIGRTSDIGGIPGWTWDSFKILLERKPEVKIPIGERFSHVTKGNLLINALSYDVGTFIDFQARKCDFDNPEFILLLEDINRYFLSGDMSVRISDYREGNAMLLFDTIHDFSWAKVHELFYFAEPVTYVGFPALSGGNGSWAKFNYRIAISEKSGQRDIAWEYLKYIIADYQYEESSQLGMGFPIKITALENKAEMAKKPLEEGVTAYQVIDDMALSYDPALSDEEMDKLLNLIYSLDFSVDNLDSRALYIISEEADSYFEGQKTAAEVAQIIQNRVSLYLSEVD